MNARPPAGTLARLLASNDPIRRAEADEWLRRLGPDAEDVLINDIALLEERSKSYQIGFLFVPVGILGSIGGSFITEGNFAYLFWFSIVPCVVWSGSIVYWQASKSQRLERERIAAVTKLVDYDAQFALGRLFELWLSQTASCPKSVLEVIGSVLTQLSVTHQALSPMWAEGARGVLRRLYHRQENGRAVLSRRDFSDEATDVLVALLRLFALSPDPADQTIIRRIARSKARRPNQQLVRDAAEAWLEAANSSAPIADTASLRPSQTVNSSPPVLLNHSRGGTP